MKKIFALSILLMLVAGLPRLTAHAKAAEDPSCSWMGGSASGSYWDDKDNWSCMPGEPHVPTQDDAVTVGAVGSQYPHLRGDTSIKSLSLSGRLYSDAATLTTTSWTASDGAFLDICSGTLVGSGTISTGATLICGHLTGDLTVGSLATLTIPPAPAAALYVNGNLTVQPLGTINAADIDGKLFLSGNTVTNNGAISVPDVYFQKGGGATQHDAGTGSWSGSNLWSIDDTVLVLDNDMTFNSKSMNIGNGAETETLAIGTHTIAFTGGSLNVGSHATITGSGTIHAKDGAEIYNVNAFNPPLVIDNGNSLVFGAFNGPITVAKDATLTVKKTPAGLVTANNTFTLNGILDGEGTDCSFYMKGVDFINNGAIKVAEVRFPDSPAPQHLTGAGTWEASSSMWIENTSTEQFLELQSDLHFKGSQLSLGNLDLGDHTAYITGPSLITFISHSHLIGTGTLSIDGNLTINAATALSFTPTLAVNSGVTTLAYGAFQGPVTVATGASLTEPLDGHVSLGNNLTLDGPFTSEGALTFNGSSLQKVTGKGSLALYDLAIENSAGVNLDVPATLGVPAMPPAMLTLDGDITTSKGITMINTVTTEGTGTIFGTVTRTGSFSLGRAYSFGNPDMAFTLTAGSSLPTSLSLTITCEKAPGLVGSILTWYHLAASGGSGWTYTLRLHYGTRELNGIMKYGMKLYQRPASGSGAWNVVADASAMPNNNFDEVTGLTTLNDWGMAGIYGLYLPVVRK